MLVRSKCQQALRLTLHQPSPSLSSISNSSFSVIVNSSADVALKENKQQKLIFKHAHRYHWQGNTPEEVGTYNTMVKIAWIGGVRGQGRRGEEVEPKIIIITIISPLQVAQMTILAPLVLYKEDF